MKMFQSKSEEVLALVKKEGILRPRDLKTHGIPREYLIRLYRQGLVKRTSRGLYIATDAEHGEHYTLAEVCKKVPNGVICLLSALRFHGFTTQSPFEIWIAIDFKARRPRLSGLSIRIVRFSGEAFHTGIEEHVIDGVHVRVFNPAKTVADCFKYRNKIGLDVSLEALRECWRERRCTMDQLWYFANVCRVTNIIRPYLESIS
jgi:predicted transcriptional regulator of viral defense system